MTTELESPFELIGVGKSEEDSVPVFIAHSGLGLLAITASKRSASDNPILFYIRAKERGIPGNSLPPTPKGEEWLDNEAIALEFHNEGAIDQLIETLQRMKEVYYPKDV